MRCPSGLKLSQRVKRRGGVCGIKTRQEFRQIFWCRSYMAANDNVCLAKLTRHYSQSFSAIAVINPQHVIRQSLAKLTMYPTCISACRWPNRRVVTLIDQTLDMDMRKRLTL